MRLDKHLLFIKPILTYISSQWKRLICHKYVEYGGILLTGLVKTFSVSISWIYPNDMKCTLFAALWKGRVVVVVVGLSALHPATHFEIEHIFFLKVGKVLERAIKAIVSVNKCLNLAFVCWSHCGQEDFIASPVTPWFWPRRISEIYPSDKINIIHSIWREPCTGTGWQPMVWRWYVYALITLYDR